MKETRRYLTETTVFLLQTLNFVNNQDETHTARLSKKAVQESDKKKVKRRKITENN